jgi:hypothetical protein
MSLSTCQKNSAITSRRHTVQTLIKCVMTPLMVFAILWLVSLSATSIAADPVSSYDWTHYTVGAHQTLVFHVRYNGGEWGDAKAIPDRHGDHDYDDIDMKVFADFDWGLVPEAKDLTSVSPHCHWWVGLIYKNGLDYVVKVRNNESHSVGFQIHFY